MDKKSNRTDLLAAGRKRLQQYRQKKDGKGKDGKAKPVKSTSKSTSEAENSEQHDDDDSLVQAPVDAPVESFLLAGKESQLHVDPDLSASVSKKSTEDSALNEPGNGPISAPLSDDKGTRELSVAAVDMAVEDSEVKETSSSSDNHCPTAPEEMQKLQIDLIHSKEAVSFGIPALDADNAESSPSASSSAPLVTADEDGGASATVELDVLKREDQVSSDVGAVQEVHCSGPEDFDRSTKLEQREEVNLPVPVVDEGVEPLAFPGGASGILSVLEQNNNLEAGDYTTCIEADGGNDMKEACTSLCSSADGQSVNIMNLVDVIKGLSEDDFAFLINSRRLPNSYADALRESLYLANISEELFHVQLLEASEHESFLRNQHKQFVDEKSMLTTSLADASQRNRSIEAEFEQIRSELKAAIFQKEELQSQSDLADSEVKKLSSEIDELKIIVEESSRSFSRLSEELDGCKLQLADSQAENKRLVNTLTSFTDQNKEIEVRDQLLDERNTELAGCWSTITALQVEIATLNINLAFVTDERMKVEEESHFLSAKNEKLSVDLADCRSMLDALEEQRSSLDVYLAELREGRRMIEEWNENLVRENERLAHEASSHKQSLSEEHDRCMQLEDDLEQARLSLEKLMEENVTLGSAMESYKAKIAQISNKQSISSSEQMDAGVQPPGHASLADADYLQKSPTKPVTKALSSVLFKSASDDHKEEMPVNNLKGGVYDDSLGFPILIGRLEEAERLLQDLEKAIGGINSRSLTLSRSIGKSAEPGVSKLIQAFEPNAHSDENESEASETTGDDLYLSAKHHTGSLGFLLKTMYQDILHADSLVKVEKEGRQSSHASHRELVVEVESWKDLCVSRELHNVGVEVQLEVLKQHMCSMEVKQIELETSYEALREEEASLRTKNTQLGEKLKDCLSRTGKLFVQLDEFGKSTRGVSSSVHDDLEDLRKDVMEKAYKLEGALLSSTATAAQAADKLNTAVGSPFMRPSQASSADGVDIDSLMLTSASAACQMIEDLKEKLQAASRENKTLSGRHEEMTTKLDALVGENKSAVELLEKISADLVNCFNHSMGAKESGTQQEAVKLCDALDASHFETIMKKLSSLLNERQWLTESNDKLNCEFLSRTNAVEELSERSSDSNLLLKLVGDIRDVLKLPPADLNSNESSLSLLQSLFPLLVERCKEADDSVRFVRDDLNSRMMELRELQEYVESLNILNFQQQNETLVLVESLKQAKDAFDAIQDELLVKVTEFEHSEQRFASVREKLSIAVAKGKGLIVQRDNLKQSLSETSMELERCSQELQLKESRLQEVEDKLKAYSEAGERVEALESELSYIRNSATALRESFLLKDSVLQRIEEILEDLELPEHFHSKDTAEKVDYLAKSVASNSLVAADLDQRISALGRSSYPDAGMVITDSWKDDAQHSSNLVEDLRRQYDELQNRFYALAEQNEMLEQSLIERNNLVQRWEGVLDRIDTPVQIRSMEPDERIQWLGTALSEADHHMSSLQQKVDNLESYCGSVSTDLEEAQRRISELEFSLQTVTYEKNNLERSSLEQNNLVQRWEDVLDRVNVPATVRSMEPVERIEWLGTASSEADHHLKSLQQKVDSLENYCDSITANLEESRTVAAELRSSLQAANGEKETLSRELAALISERDKSLEEKSQFKQDVDGLKSEVDTLKEKLVGKHEVDKHILQIESEMLRWRDLIVEALQSCGTESLTPDGSNPCESLEFLIQRLVGEYMRFSKQIHDESRARDAVAEEVQSSINLRRELDVAISELEHLKEERDVYVTKSQSSVSELEELEKKKEELQNLLKQEEQKSASLREKLNVAVRKGKSLVQHRDALKQSIEGSTAEIDRLKSEINMRESSIVVFEQKIKDLSSQLDSSHILQSENVSLRNQLTVTTQHLHDTEHTLSLIIQKLSEIDINSDLDISNPVLKLEEIQKLCANMRGAVISSEQETKKAKRASELLLAELNEVQERSDIMQEDLAKAYKEMSDISKQKDIAESAKLQVLSRMQDLAEETRNQRAEYDSLKSSVSKLERGFSDVSNVIANAFAKDVDILHRLRANMRSYAKVLGSDLQLTGAPSGVHVSSEKEGYQAAYSFQGPEAADQSDDVGFHLSQLTRNVELFKEQIRSDSLSLQDEAEMLLNFIDNLHSEVASLKASLESAKAEFLHLESTEKKRDMDCATMRQGISLLYGACCSSIMEIESRKAQLVGGNVQSEEMGSKLRALPLADGGLNISEQNLLTSAENVRSLGDRLLLSVTDFITMHARSMEADQKEMRATISNLRKELQEKDIQKERMCTELVSQIKVAEATATGYSRDLQTAKVQLHDVQRRLQLMEEERNVMENRITDLQKKHVDSVELQDKVSSLTGVIAAKEQEIEVLMQALDEEENQMEGFKAKIEELELDVEKKNVDLEQALAARAKAMKKLSITVNKFDELHHMSEGLLSEIENLQTQLQDRESEISFLRQEVTRCTNDVLLASKTVKERNANELQDLLTWLETQFSQFVMQEVHDDNHNDQSIEYKDRLQKLIASVISELEELRVATQRKDASLQLERKKVEELAHAKEALEASLCARESHLSSLLNGGDSGQSTSEIVEVESVINKWVAPVTSTASQVRSLRKSNNEQVAIAIGADTADSGRLEDEDDDKVHGFKSLTTSRFVPKFTRPVSDMIDGLWVSCDRALMRQPGLRLGIMIYWAIMHALLATFVV